MPRVKYVILALIVGLFSVGSAVYLMAAIVQTMDPGDPVHFTGVGELDVPVLKMNGSIVGSSAPVIVTVRANQALNAGTGSTTILQHASRTDAIEMVQVSGNGTAVTSSQNPRIAAGQQGQIIVVQGTSPTNTWTLPDGNGVKLASATSLTFDDRTSMPFRYDSTGGTWRQMVTIAGGGGGGGGTAASISFSPTGDIAATNLQTGLAEVDIESEKVALKNANSGYLGLNSSGDATWDRVDSYATHIDLSATSQIDAAALAVRTIGIQNTGAGNVTLTTGNPRITGCTAPRDGTRLVLRGLHATKTVTIPTGQGVKLAGNTGSVIIGANLSPVEFQCNGTTLDWEQIGVPSAQQAFNVGSTVAIYACGNALNPKFDGGGGTSMEWCLDANGDATWKVLKAGAATDSVVQLSAGKVHRIKNSGGTDILTVTESTGVTSGTFTRPMMMGEDNNSRLCSDGTWYLYPSGRFVSLTASQTDQIMSGSYTFSNFTINHSAAIGASETRTFTLLKNGSATSMTCSIIAGASVGTGEIGTSTDRECQDTNAGHNVSVVALDRLTIRVTCSGGSSASGFVSTAIQYQ